MIQYTKHFSTANASVSGISINHVSGMEQELSMIAFLLQQSVRLDPPANSVTMGTASGRAEPTAKPTPSHLRIQMAQH